MALDILYPNGQVLAVTPFGSPSSNQPDTSITSSVASSMSNQVLLAANVDRLGATIHNDSSEHLLVKLGLVATLTDFTVGMAPASYYEVPFAYIGAISGLWLAVNGAARITELT